VRSCVTSAFVCACALALGLLAGAAHAEDGAKDTSDTIDTDEATGPAATPWRRPPVSLRGGYTLDRGQVLLSYRFERLGHDELQSGRDHVSPASLLGVYESAPETLDLDRHVFSALWSPVPQLTFQVELPFLRSVTDQIHRPAAEIEGFETLSTGFGDVMLWVLYRVYRDAYSDLHLNLGLSFPSGSIAEAQPLPLGATPGSLQRLSYPLQLGSGTVDLQPGFTYAGHYDAAAWGLQGLAILRAGTNEFDYILGNQYEVMLWGGWAWNEWLSNSFSMRWTQRFGGTGADPRIDPTTSSMNDFDHHAFERLDALFGVAIEPSGGVLERTRWVLDAGLPAYQNFEGPQPRVKWLVQFALEVTI